MIYIGEESGHRTIPWGTPYVTKEGDDFWPSMMTSGGLAERNSQSSPGGFP